MGIQENSMDHTEVFAFQDPWKIYIHPGKAWDLEDVMGKGGSKEESNHLEKTPSRIPGMCK